MGRASGATGHLRVRPLEDPRAGLLDRHPSPDRLRLAARRARLLLHPHRPDRPLPADARQGGLLPDGLGRQRPADRAPGAELLRRALRPVAPLRPRLHPAGEARPEEAGPDQPAELHRAVRDSWSRRTRRPSRRCGARSACRSTGSQTYTTIGARRPDRLPARLPAQLRPRRGLPAGGADAVGRHLPDRGRPGRARGPRVPRRTTTGSPSTGPTAPRCTSRPPGPS